MDSVNTWWDRLPGERFWLDVTERDDRDRMLAVPRGVGKQSAAWAHRLITHVRGGDLVFHYDASQEAIAACSIAQGRVEKRDLAWPVATRNGDAGMGTQLLPSWSIGLRHSTRLVSPLPLAAIAHTQWHLFPVLRALEDAAGDPLYYPFEMGDREGTRPLLGYVFKLPAVFVQSFPELVSAVARAAQPAAAYERSRPVLVTARPPSFASQR